MKVNSSSVVHDAPVPVDRLTPQRRRAMTRNALIDAAIEVFARRGFHGASLDEIAEAAGFTRGAIYSNFGGKEDLFLAVVERINERQLATFATTVEGDDVSTGERTTAAATLWRHAVLRDPTLLPLTLELRLYALRNPAFRQRLADADRKQHEEIARLAREGARAAGGTTKMDPDDFAVIARAISEGMLQLAAVDDEHADRYDRLVREAFALLGRAMLDSAP